jgi:hypothetical protein
MAAPATKPRPRRPRSHDRRETGGHRIVDPELEALQRRIAERLGYRLVDHRWNCSASGWAVMAPATGGKAAGGTNNARCCFACRRRPHAARAGTLVLALLVCVPLHYLYRAFAWLPFPAFWR